TTSGWPGCPRRLPGCPWRLPACAIPTTTRGTPVTRRSDVSRDMYTVPSLRRVATHVAPTGTGHRCALTMQKKTPARSRRFLILKRVGGGLRLPLPQCRQAVVARPREHGLLRLSDVADQVLRPQLQRRRLHRATVGEAQRPRVRAHAVHRVKVRGRVLVGLAAGQEHD